MITYYFGTAQAEARWVSQLGSRAGLRISLQVHIIYFLHICIYLCLRMYAFMHACMYVCMYVFCVCMYLNIHVNVGLKISIYVYIYRYRQMYECLTRVIQEFLQKRILPYRAHVCVSWFLKLPDELRPKPMALQPYLDLTTPVHFGMKVLRVAVALIIQVPNYHIFSKIVTYITTIRNLSTYYWVLWTLGVGFRNEVWPAVRRGL